MDEKTQAALYRSEMGQEAFERQSKAAADERRWGPCVCGPGVYLNPTKAAPGLHHTVRCGRFKR